MEEINGIYEFVWPHWPGLMWMFIAALFVQIEKGAIFTKYRAHKKARFQSFWWWGRKLMASHGALLGLVVGIFWQNPENADPAWPWMASLVYFAFFGGTSVFLFEAIKGWAKKRGIKIGGLPGIEDLATPPPSEE
jgi:hypothetical protein